MSKTGRRKVAGPRGDASDLTDGVAASPAVSMISLDGDFTSADEGMPKAEKRFKPGSPAARRAAAAAACSAAVAAAEASGSADSVVAAGGSSNVFVVPMPSDFFPVEDDTLLSDVKSDRKSASKKSKKKKRAATASAPSSASVVHPEASSVAVAGNGVLLRRLKAISGRMMDEVLVDGVDPSLARKIVGYSAEYEELLMGLMLENERLRGRAEAGGVAVAGMAGPIRSMSAVPVAPALVSASAVTAPAAPAVIPKPVETWSVVVKGGKGATSSEVVDKVVTEVGPTLGVRVHDLRPMRGGGAVLRTPSVAEREKVAANAKFKEVGLEVSVSDKLGPRVIVQRVHPEISPDEFMGDLYEMNLKEVMSMDEYRRTVRLVTAPWRPTGGPINVILEGGSVAMQHLLDIGRCYVKWFSFVVRPHDAVPCCFRCLGFDHMVKECRSKESVCRLCCQAGHVASRCVNGVNCRNCAFKGLPSGHLMMSAACPVYAALVARANARH